MKENSGRMEINLPAALDLPAAFQLKELLIEALAHDGDGAVILSGGAVERVSTACLQVLAAAVVSFRAHVRLIGIEHPSQPLVDSFRHLGLEDEFNELVHS